MIRARPVVAQRPLMLMETETMLPADLVPVAAADTRGPAALAAAGLDVEACWR